MRPLYFVVVLNITLIILIDLLAAVGESQSLTSSNARQKSTRSIDSKWETLATITAQLCGGRESTRGRQGLHLASVALKD
jgi:hypothetical protein